MFWYNPKIGKTRPCPFYLFWTLLTPEYFHQKGHRYFGLPEPVLKEEQGGFLSKIFKDRFTEEQLKKAGLNDRQIKAVVYVKKIGKITNKDYQRINNCSRNTATGDLGNLVKEKILKPSDVKGAGSFYVLK